MRIRRVTDHEVVDRDDHVALEGPLEIFVEGAPFAVVMRTPGADAELAIGFLFSEGVVRTAADLTEVTQTSGSD